MQTRFLLVSISSLLFSGETTLDEIHDALARDAETLFTDGIPAPWLNSGICLKHACLYADRSSAVPEIGPGQRLFFSCIGVKGDQVFLRKVPSLQDHSIVSKHRPTASMSQCRPFTCEWDSTAKRSATCAWQQLLAFNNFCEQPFLNHDENPPIASKDWDNPSVTASWRHEIPRTTSAFNEVEIPLLRIPGVAGPESALPDSAHIFHIKGIGQSFTTSCVVFLAHLGVWQGRSFDKKLHQAYCTFRQWCTHKRKTTAIDGFSKTAFDMKENLGACLYVYAGPSAGSFVCPAARISSYLIASGTAPIPTAMVGRASTLLYYVPGWKIICRQSTLG